MKPFRLLLIAFVLLIMAAPVFAFPGEGAFKWLADQTGLTEQVWQWIGAFIVIPGMGWLMSKSTWDTWEKQWYVLVFGFAKKLNGLIISVPVLGVFWEKFFEAFVIKWVFGVFRILAITPIALAAGFNSVGESLAGSKPPKPGEKDYEG
jgi:hypothetical protein